MSKRLLKIGFVIIIIILPLSVSYGLTPFEKDFGYRLTPLENEYVSQLVGLNVAIAIQTMKADLYDDFSKGSCYRKEEAYINHESQSDVRLRRLESECTEYTNKYDTATAERKKAYEKKDALRIKVIERYQKLPKWWDTAEALGDAMDDVNAKSSKTKKK